MLPAYVLTFCRIAIGLVFTVSFVGKARNVAAFEQSIARFEMLPRWLEKRVAPLFLVAEFGVVALMVGGGDFLVIGFALGTSLLLVFSIAIASVLVRKIRSSCNCFGSDETPVSVHDVWRNAAFILCALGGMGALAVSSPRQNNADSGMWLFAGLSAVVFVVVCIQLREIVHLIRQD